MAVSSADLVAQPDETATDTFESVALALVAGLAPGFRAVALVLLLRQYRDILRRLAIYTALTAEWYAEVARVVADFGNARGLYQRQWVAQTEPLILEAMQDGASPVAEISAKALEQAAVEQAKALAQAVSQTTASRLADALSREALAAVPLEAADAESIVGAAIQDAVLGPQQDARARAERIAKHEAATAAAHGEFIAAEDAGFELGTWQHDGRPKEPRVWHAALHGLRVPVGETFPGTTVRFPRDPLGGAEDVINCTCSITYSKAAG